MKTPILLAAALVSSGCATQTTSGNEAVTSNTEPGTSSSEVDTSAPHTSAPHSLGTSSTDERRDAPTARDASVVSDRENDSAPDGRGETSTKTASSAALSPEGDSESQSDAETDKPFERPQLVVSGFNRYWSEETLVESAEEKADIVVNETNTYQKWLGFSGGLNEAGWETLLALSESDRATAVELLFGKSGLHLTLGQIPIGSGESALARYFPHDVDGDYAMEHFSIQRDEVNLIPYVEAARAANPELSFWAVPWTPPPWMKTNLAADGGRIRNEPEVLQAYALYLAKFIEAYRDKGLDMGALHLQTEVDHESHYPSCLWDPETLRDFAKDYLLPTLDARGLDLELWAGDFIESGSSAWVNVLLDEPELAPRLAGVGLAWGTIGELSGVAERHDVPILQTQHRHGNPPYVPQTFSDVPPNDYAYGLETWSALEEWLEYSSAYNIVNLVLDSQGLNLDTEQPWPQNALLVVDRETKTLRTTPAYYVVRHLSQFLDPGAVRIGDTQGHDALAFKNPDGSIVVVLHNRLSAPLDTTLGARGTVFELTVPAEGWATVFLD